MLKHRFPTLWYNHRALRLSARSSSYFGNREQAKSLDNQIESSWSDLAPTDENPPLRLSPRRAPIDQITSVQDQYVELDGAQAQEGSIATPRPPVPAALPARAAWQTIQTPSSPPPSEPALAADGPAQSDWSNDLASIDLSGRNTPAARGGSSLSASQSPGRKVRKHAETSADRAAEAR